MIQWQKQKGRTCGQNAVSMLTGKPISEVIRDTGKKCGTKTKHLIAVLHQYGYETSDKLKSYREVTALPPIAICKFGWQKPDGKKFHGWHWILWAEGRFWDGNEEAASSIDLLISLYGLNCRLVSFLEVRVVG